MVTKGTTVTTVVRSALEGVMQPRAPPTKQGSREKVANVAVQGGAQEVALGLQPVGESEGDCALWRWCLGHDARDVLWALVGMTRPAIYLRGGT